MAEKLAPIPEREDLIDLQSRKVSKNWLRWLDALKTRAEESAGPGGTIDASQIVSGTLAIARLAGITNAQISNAAAIAWSKISKVGATLADFSGILPISQGGTGVDLSATGGTSKYLKQSAVGANVSVGTIAAADLPTGIDATKIADGSVDNTEFQYINSLRSNAQDQIDTKLWWQPFRRSWTLNFFPGNQIPIGFGLPGMTATGALSNGSTTDHQGTTITTSAAATTGGPRINGSIALFRWGNDPHYRLGMKTGSAITDMRINFGFYTATTLDSDGGSINAVTFRYSTTAGDSNWQALTNDGSATPTLTNTGVAVAANTEYEFGIVPSGDGTTVKFYINGALVATHTTKVPAASTLFFPIWTFATQTAVSKAMTYFWAYGEYD